MNNLEINKEIKDDEVILKCNGRLDANRTGYLNDYIDSLVREGQYRIALDMAGVEYLSSAGIRLLVTQHKNLKSVNGHFYLSVMSDNVRTILQMVGMADMLSQSPTQSKKEDVKQEPQDKLDTQGFHFNLTTLSPDGTTDLGIYGQPELTFDSGFKSENARRFQSGENHFSIGLGAIGESFDECKDRFGEYVVLGKDMAYLPADGSRKPDYIVGSGQLVATLTELYGLHFEGNFSHLVRFVPENPINTIGFSQLAESFQKLTKLPQMAIVMVAESGGLIGTSLNASPVEGKKIFTYPEIKETVNFTTEPAHYKMLTISVGYVSFEKEGAAEPFLRPMLPDSPLTGHIHTAVFPYIPLKKTEIDLYETIERLFETSELIDIIHILNDTRDAVGLGESQFVQGFCWIAPVKSVHFIPTK
ncbi:MAG: STAS domain-containing protein [Bacteroidales bacterium]|nr:STAS domain-containing protein [Bacteroidales bacterium]